MSIPTQDHRPLDCRCRRDERMPCTPCWRAGFLFANPEASRTKR